MAPNCFPCCVPRRLRPEADMRLRTGALLFVSCIAHLAGAVPGTLGFADMLNFKDSYEHSSLVYIGSAMSLAWFSIPYTIIRIIEFIKDKRQRLWGIFDLLYITSCFTIAVLMATTYMAATGCHADANVPSDNAAPRSQTVVVKKSTVGFCLLWAASFSAEFVAVFFMLIAMTSYHGPRLQEYLLTRNYNRSSGEP